MIFKFFTAFIFTCLHLISMSVIKKSPGVREITNNNDENFQFVNEKKIQFTGNSAQYVQFDVKLPGVLDFAMCVWYKPQVILDNNILFSYGSKDRQLILWKIKKKRENLIIILKISNLKIMEEKLDTLTIGQWHHLCQYWQGSTGLWSLFLNTYIVSFGFINMENTTNWHLNGVNMSATINHPSTKKTLHGELYGFHLMSTNYNGPEFGRLTGMKLLPTPVLPLEMPRNKRQTESIDPETPESRTPFFRLRNFFKFIRRMISLVTVPVFRFTRRLIQPWTRRFVPLRPTTTGKTPSPTTPAVTTTTVRPSVGNATATLQNGTNSQNNTVSNPTAGNRTSPAIKNLTDTKNSTQKLGSSLREERFNSFDESIVIYESEIEPAEQRQSRNAMNISKATTSSAEPDSVEQLASSSSEENPFTDKCAFIAEKMDTHRGANSKENFVTPSNEKPTDAITLLGPHLLFVQFLYACCPIEGNNVLISWEKTKVSLHNVVIDTIEGCANF